MDRAPLGPNIDRSHVIKDDLDCYWLKTFETAKGKKGKWCHRELNPGPLAKLPMLRH